MSINFTEVYAKPKSFKGIKDHLRKRVSGSSLGSWQNDVDVFGNKQFISRNIENILGSKVNPSLLISIEGAELFAQNPSLRAQIKDPSRINNAKIIGEAREAIVVKLPLVKNNLYKDYVVKYAFATSSDNAKSPAQFLNRIAFTPGCDAMRLMQWFKKNQSSNSNYKDVQTLPILIATNDITVSPLIEDALPLDMLLKRFEDPRQQLGNYFKWLSSQNNLSYPEEAVQIAQEMYEYDSKTDVQQRFLPQIAHYTTLITAGLTEHLTDEYKKGFPFKLVTPVNAQVTFKEAEIARNKLVNLKLLKEVWIRWKNSKEKLTLPPEQVQVIDKYRTEIEKGLIGSVDEIQVIKGALSIEQKQFLGDINNCTTTIELMQSYLPR